MQIRSFRGSGEPVWVIALLSAGERLGLDPRRALGPAVKRAASTGRTRDRTRPMLQNVRKFLPGRRPHVTHCRHWLHRWVRPKIYSLADLLGGLMSTINAATICIAAAKANGTT
jgi:hypothetical protein